jgi:hypothetical protein
VLPGAHCRCASANVNITNVSSVSCDAKNSFDGLCWQAAAGLRLPRAALVAMAISAAAPTFQGASSPGAKLCALDPGLRNRAPRHVTGPVRNCDVGARPAHRIIELVSRSGMGRCDRDVSVDGLRILVVALGDAHGAALLAVS